MGTMLYRVVEENLRAAMRCYARVNELGEARDYPGLTVAWSGTGCAVFNSAMLTAPTDAAGLSRALSLAGVHFGQRRVGWTFWLCEDLMPKPAIAQARSTFRSSGMFSIAEAPGMYAEELPPPKRTARLRIVRVENEGTRRDFAYLSSAIFALPLDMAKTIYAGPGLWRPPMTGWVGYDGDRPVSIATVVIGGGAAGVYSVGTLPAYQRRGFAETVMRHALEETRRETGISVSVLQSTHQGLGLYARMGYRVVTRFAVYLQEGRSWDQ